MPYFPSLQFLVEATTLELLQTKENDGRGIYAVRSIVHYLREGDLESAKAVRMNEGDKTRNYPRIEAELLTIFGCRLHCLHNCQHWLCKEG